mmetsp:Transcript_6935/g.14354  ORF Transcript_6935/g.14354 Transcript_6935/m.14354 type:complete len:158 (-) Transcript_6935:874-1347(-)|eukprot:CAMPEP_0184678074 /NCGR_PEP_ID=MMETSP0312-20130426/703_1 /TAXON_ID=31354 /ORGANISM="Compsopogon coeruleus, Strain SAG 36.94" /LENGTH=157 /DNA_ID=CAMNT_0027126437 /DNA_START=114 /DNA_END=587 /DNA_ORIENTATION=+
MAGVFALVGASSAAVAGVVTVAVKAVGEWEATVNPMSPVTLLRSNALARQGESVPSLEGEGSKLARQRAGGIQGGISRKLGESPTYLDKVPAKAVGGDNRGSYITVKGNFTNSQGTIEDILSKVPNRGTYGATEDYRRAARPEPKRAAGYDNQSFPQ